MNMKLEEALNIINVVCAKFIGTRQEHQTIDQALMIIKANLKEEEEN